LEGNCIPTDPLDRRINRFVYDLCHLLSIRLTNREKNIHSEINGVSFGKDKTGAAIAYPFVARIIAGKSPQTSVSIQHNLAISAAADLPAEADAGSSIIRTEA
jgi:hypothetical protein